MILLCLNQSLALSPGDIIFTGYNADGIKGFSILALVDIPATSTIYFTDNNWNGSPIGGGGAFVGSEGELTWVTGGAVIPAGSTIIFTDLLNASPSATLAGAAEGTVTRTGSFNNAAANETIYAFEGSDESTPDTFLSAISNDDFVTAPLTNTGLAGGTNAIGIIGDEDVMVYTGGASCANPADCLTDILDTGANWSTQDGSGDQDNDAVTPDFPADVSNFLTLLPIELLSFDVQITESEEILLTWQTSAEINNDFFSIERSRDGSSWDVILDQPGAGNSNTVQSYNAIDRLPLAGVSYYRLKQTDYDGQFSHSWVRQVNLAAEDQLRIYPNPAQQWVMVEGLLPEDLTIYSMGGRDISGEIRRQVMDRHLRIHIGHLAKGVYILKSPVGTRTFVKN